ncbi:hypothetical protein R1sor_012483 [Riccia sorocarpa]|uniref:Uncharacterized protein n=1 Tax=Riccia sorocarpa TaxID=122646 RepID=A0ABD3I6L1_9MARC
MIFGSRQWFNLAILLFCKRQRTTSKIEQKENRFRILPTIEDEDNDEPYHQTCLFLWFAHNVEEKESIRQFYTPRTDKGAIRFIQKSVDLGITSYEKRETNLDEIPLTPITKTQEKTMRIWAAKIQFRWVEEFKMWFESGRPRNLKPNTFSANQKACEPISDNVLCWIRNPQQLTRLTDGKKIGGGTYDNVYKVGIKDHGLGNELGMV